MSGLRKQTISVTTTGADAAATGTATSAQQICGAIEKIVVNYHTSAPNTTDITITMPAATNGVAETVYTKDNSATDAILYSRTPVCNYQGTAGAAGDNLWDKFLCLGNVTVTLAGCNALTGAVVVTVFYESYD